ncbi:MAG: hypothetical protein RSC36_07110, partial [Ruthenibacterium sp.]
MARRSIDIGLSVKSIEENRNFGKRPLGSFTASAVALHPSFIRGRFPVAFCAQFAILLSTDMDQFIVPGTDASLVTPSCTVIPVLNGASVLFFFSSQQLPRNWFS